MKPNIEISDAHLKHVAELLNTLLADEFVLYTKTRSAHWNVQGPGFIELHKFFQSQYEALDIIIDDVAERIRTLGHYALGSLKRYLDVTDMLEDTTKSGQQRRLIQTLLHDHETITHVIRNDIAPIADNAKDLGTADMVTGILEQHEKMAWMLRSHLSEH